MEKNKMTNGTEEELDSSPVPQKKIIKKEVEEDDPSTVTEEDIRLKEKQEKLEADLIREQMGIEPVKEKKKKKAKSRKGDTIPVNPLLQDANDVQLFNEIISTSKLLRRLSIILACIIGFVFIFASANYLHYNYLAEGGFDVTVKKHEHVYTLFGRRVEGDCQTYGYTIYLCEFQYCKSETQVKDTEYGNHKYREEPQIYIDPVTGESYKEYVCSVCSEKNRVPIVIPNDNA